MGFRVQGLGFRVLWIGIPGEHGSHRLKYGRC